MRGKPLSETHPELAAQAAGWDPSLTSAGVANKLSWRCASGHVWEARLSSRARQGAGCPYCAGQRAIVGLNDLATINPELAAEADGWDPTTLMPQSNKKVGWRCALDHKWEARVAQRTNGTGCPYCSGNLVAIGFNDLVTTHPEIAGQAIGWDPKTVSKGSISKKQWLCPSGHLYDATPNNRCNGRGCPVCTGHKVQVGFNDLATTNPKLAAEASGWDPTKLTQSSNKKVDWKCTLGHRWKAEIASRNDGNGCPICSGKSVLIGFNDLATTNPDLATEADGWDPTTITAGSGVKKNWMCSTGHRWKAEVGSRVLGRGCPICAGKVVLAGFNDLATLNSALAAEADGWNPKTVTVSSGSIKQWKCSNGHRWKASVANRNKGTGCAVCSGHKVLAGFNDLATVRPELAAEADGWNPKTVTFGSGSMKQWKCSNGHRWKAVVASRASGRGCPSCAKTGFDPNAEGWLYFLIHEIWGLLQIGISNEPEVRLRTHGAAGWEVLEVRGPMPGVLTHQWEQDILHALQRRGVSLAPEHVAGKFSGYTEAWIQEDFPANSLSELMQLVHNDEEIPK